MAVSKRKPKATADLQERQRYVDSSLRITRYAQPDGFDRLIRVEYPQGAVHVPAQHPAARM
jgi:hypothetical protein